MIFWANDHLGISGKWQNCETFDQVTTRCFLPSDFSRVNIRYFFGKMLSPHRKQISHTLCCGLSLSRRLHILVFEMWFFRRECFWPSSSKGTVQLLAQSIWNWNLKCSDTSFALNPATRKNGTVFALFRDRIVKRKKEPDQSEGTVGVELIINVPRWYCKGGKVESAPNEQFPMYGTGHTQKSELTYIITWTRGSFR